MKLCIRGHDLGVTGIGPIRDKLTAYGLDGVQLVAYKSCPDLAYVPGLHHPGPGGGDPG